MAKSRAQRKAEQRKRRQDGSFDAGQVSSETDPSSERVAPESAPGVAAEVSVDAAPEAPQSLEVIGWGAEAESADADATGPERPSRRRERQIDRAKRDVSKRSTDRRKPRDAPVEKQRGRIATYFSSVVRELGRVQWPNRETLVQASGITLVFVAVAAIYLGLLDALFNALVQLIL